MGIRNIPEKFQSSKYKKTTLNSSGEKQVIYNGRKLRLTRVILFQNSSLKMWVLEENERMSLE